MPTPERTDAFEEVLKTESEIMYVLTGGEPVGHEAWNMFHALIAKHRKAVEHHTRLTVIK